MFVVGSRLENIKKKKSDLKQDTLTSIYAEIKVSLNREEVYKFDGKFNLDSYF
jgi:hypothetical protein